jgi:hypothetical protein
MSNGDVGALLLQRCERLFGGSDRGDLGATLREDVSHGPGARWACRSTTSTRTPSRRESLPEPHCAGVYREATYETVQKCTLRPRSLKGWRSLDSEPPPRGVGRVGRACLVEPARPPDLTPERERLLELDADLSPGPLRSSACAASRARRGRAEPGMPEAGVVHPVTVPSARARWWLRESSVVIRFAIQRRLQVVYRDPKYFAELPPV